MARNGKAFNEYLHQAAPETAVVHFSDRPLKVAGVRYQPKWAWSDIYRKWFREGHRDIAGRSSAMWGYPYRNWLCNERGISGAEADQLINNQRQAA